MAFQNFDKQLGLYTKTVKEMHLANAVVEDLSFVPRLIPLSLSHPVLKVACGLKFALVITKVSTLCGIHLCPCVFCTFAAQYCVMVRLNARLVVFHALLRVDLFSGLHKPFADIDSFCVCGVLHRVACCTPGEPGNVDNSELVAAPTEKCLLL